MIDRQGEVKTLINLLKRHRIVGIIGARQVGKTTLVRLLLKHISKESAYYDWATHGGAEIDLFVIRGRQRLGFEIKLTSSPRVTASMRIALEDLKLQQLYIIHAGEQTFQIEQKIKAVALLQLPVNL